MNSKCIIGLFIVLVAACQSGKKDDMSSSEDELTRLLNLAKHVELTVAGDSCLQNYDSALV